MRAFLPSLNDVPLQKNKHGTGNSPFLIENTSSNGGFSSAIGLVSNGCCGGWHPQRPSVGCFQHSQDLRLGDGALKGDGRDGWERWLTCSLMVKTPITHGRFHLIIHGRFHVALILYLHELWKMAILKNGLENIPIPWNILGMRISGYTPKSQPPAGNDWWQFRPKHM